MAAIAPRTRRLPNPRTSRHSILEFDTELITRSWSGENLFEAAAMHVPRELATDGLRVILECLHNELMVAITLGDALRPLAS